MNWTRQLVQHGGCRALYGATDSQLVGMRALVEEWRRGLPHDRSCGRHKPARPLLAVAWADGAGLHCRASLRVAQQCGDRLTAAAISWTAAQAHARRGEGVAVQFAAFAGEGADELVIVEQLPTMRVVVWASLTQLANASAAR